MKVGVIGLGKIGQRHALNLKSLGHEVDTYDPARGHKPERLKDVIDESEAIVIASPTEFHARQIIQADRKSMFVEKPISDSPLDPGFAAKVTMVGYNLRFHHCVLQAKAWIDGGMIGQPIWANFVCAEWKVLSKGSNTGVILNWSHEIDLALHLLGACNVRSCVAADYNNDGRPETIADIVLTHSLSECQSTIHLDYLTEPNIRQSIIVGEKAAIILDLISHHAWLRSREGGIMDHVEGQSWDQMYADEIESFIARANGKETVGCTGSEGLEVLRVCLAAQQLASRPPSGNSSETCLPVKKSERSSHIIRPV